MSERLNNFLGDTPGKTFVRLLIISFCRRHHHEYVRPDTG